MPRKPVVAIVGRPNVGKSTLFNRLIGQRRAIVEDLPGTTRDRLYGDVEWGGRLFIVIDTGGLELEPSDQVMSGVASQVRVAIEEADVILLAVDSVDGLTGADEEIAQLLRRGISKDCKSSRAGKPVIVVPGKADNQARRDAANEFYALGFDTVIPVSGYHGSNVGDLLDEVVTRLPPRSEAEEEEEDDRLRIAIVGRPNVGKSSLLNKLLGEERVVVSDIPGTTRDSIDTEITFEDREIVLIDTAGIRRRGKVEPGIEKYSVLRSLRAVERADVGVLLVDATEMVTAQDLHIAGEILDEGRGVVVVVNKWDLVEKDTHTIEQYLDEISREFNFMRWVPTVFISAKTGQRVRRVLEEAIAVDNERRRRIPTSQLNDLIERALAQHSPPSRHGKPVKVYFGTQADVTPPTFVFFVNDPTLVHFSLSRFLENTIRETYGFRGTPIRMRFRKRHEDREKKGRSA